MDGEETNGQRVRTRKRSDGRSRVEGPTQILKTTNNQESKPDETGLRGCMSINVSVVYRRYAERESVRRTRDEDRARDRERAQGTNS